MSSRAAKSRLMCALATLALCLAACGESDDAGYPESEVSLEQATAPLPDASPALQDIRDQANQLLDGDLADFEDRIADLKGTPIVVNKWASWCGPCIFEFPHFQEAAIDRGEDVAFLGIDFDDPTDAAETFLARLPLPYPSYSDPDGKLSRALEADYPPTTVFIGSDGEITYRKYGPYKSADDLLADIDMYASQ